MASRKTRDNSEAEPRPTPAKARAPRGKKASTAGPASQEAIPRARKPAAKKSATAGPATVPNAAPKRAPRKRPAAAPPATIAASSEAELQSFPAVLPPRTDPVHEVVGPPTGAVTARPVAPGAVGSAGNQGNGRSGPWVRVAVIAALAALLIALVVGGAYLFGPLGSAGNLPGSPGLSMWPLLAGIALLAAVVLGARIYALRRNSPPTAARSRGWRRLLDTRVLGTLIAAILGLAAVVLPTSSPNYSPDVRALPGEVSGLIQQAVAQKEQGYPRIRISRVNVDLLLVKGDGKTPPVKYEAFTYPNADHLLAEQNKPGNTYVYAHARTGMFWELHNLNIGDTIEIDYGGGKISKYRVSELHKNVSWKDFSWLQPTGDDRLTLQTCNGYRDEDPRFIVVAHKITDTKTALTH